MNINLTLIVQMINFGIAYFLLTKFLFKPLVNLIQAHERWRHAVADSIAQSRECTKQKEYQLLRQKQEGFAQFANHYPQPEKYETFTIPSIKVINVASSEITQPLIQELSQKIVNRMKHVHL